MVQTLGKAFDFEPRGSLLESLRPKFSGYNDSLNSCYISRLYWTIEICVWDNVIPTKLERFISYCAVETMKYNDLTYCCVSGSNAWPQRHIGGVAGSARKSSRVGQCLPRLPLGTYQGLPVYHSAPAHPGHDSRLSRQGPPEDHHRGCRPREGVRGRPEHTVHLLLGPAQRVQTGNLQNQDPMGRCILLYIERSKVQILTLTHLLANI